MTEGNLISCFSYTFYAVYSFAFVDGHVVQYGYRGFTRVPEWVSAPRCYSSLLIYQHIFWWHCICGLRSVLFFIVFFRGPGLIHFSQAMRFHCCLTAGGSWAVLPWSYLLVWLQSPPQQSHVVTAKKLVQVLNFPLGMNKVFWIIAVIGLASCRSDRDRFFVLNIKKIN